MPEYDETALYEADESLYPEDIPEEFYDGSEQGLWEQEEGDEDMEEAYSMYLDARKRFAELRAARGYWPVVALPPESQGQSSSSSPPSTGGLVKGKSKGKGKGASKGKSKGRSSQRPIVPKRGTMVQRTMAAGYNVNCLKCGQLGHWAAQCPMGSRSSTTSPPKKLKTSDGQAMVASGYVDHHQPMDVVLATIDTGASSVVIGHNPLMIVLSQLLKNGINLDDLQFRPASKIFHFGGDATGLASWSIHLPVTIEGSHGRLQVFIVDGNTPFLVGRPILQHFAVMIDYQKDAITVHQGPWKPALRGHKGEYMIQLSETGNMWSFDAVSFDLMTDETVQQLDERNIDDCVDLKTYLEQTQRTCPAEINLNVEEDLDEPPQQQDSFEPAGKPMAYDEDQNLIYREITNKLMNTLHSNQALARAKQRQQVEHALRAYDRGTMMMWEVYSGQGNLAQAFHNLGYETLCFDINNGWDFSQSTHRRAFLDLQQRCAPHFIWMAPPCTKWSPLQRLNVKDDLQRELLQCERDQEEHSHLRFCKQVFKRQVLNLSHAGIEQPKPAESWNTKTFRQLDDYWHKAHLDQCALGAWLPDQHGIPTPIKKPTALGLSDEGLASTLTVRCPGCLNHLPIEGSSPEIGNRAAASATYQINMCKTIAKIVDKFLRQTAAEQTHAADDEEPMSNAEHPSPPAEDEPSQPPQHQTTDDTDMQQQPPAGTDELTGIMNKLQPTTSAAAMRTITRLHRNLGHPTNEALHKLLRERGANENLLGALDQFNCHTCAQRQHPPQVPKTGMYRGTFFNDRVQADTMWLRINRGEDTRPVPILVMSDTTTRLVAARLIPDEKTSSFLQALERGWIRHFGTMNVLQVDERRGWCSDAMLDWASQHNVELQISPGKAHERLSILERRHQVVRRAVELFLFENGDFSNEGIVKALNYTIPQINRQPNVHGFSPMQWTLGYTPALPGSLTEETVTPAQLNPTEVFRQKLEYQQLATTSIAQASTDDRLRRALLRQHRGNAQVLKLGERCHYYRDLPHDKSALGPKVVWRGPAVVVMIEPENKVYWLSHGAVLIRASFEHVRPVPGSTPTDDDATLPIDKAKSGLDAIRNRGTTRYLDLVKSNKRRASDMDTDDEMVDIDDQDMPDFNIGLPSQPSSLKRTISDQGTDEPPNKAPREMEQVDTTPNIPTGLNESSGSAPPDLDSTNQAGTISQQPEVGDSERLTAGSGGSHPVAGTPPQPPQQEAPAGAASTTGANPETFAQQRARHEQSETQTLFRALRSTPSSTARREATLPYPTQEMDKALHQTDVDVLDKSHLPPGWTTENGYVVLDKIQDEWQLQGNWLYWRHYVARETTFAPEADDCPVPLEWLQKDRETYDGNSHRHDRWKHGQTQQHGPWTGWTRFKISACHRKEAQQAFYTASDGHNNLAQKKKAAGINERHLSLIDKLAFVKAKQKELQSFFDNQVWQFDDGTKVPADRILGAHFILKWSANEDGTPRAKARLIVQGFRDPDALAGRLKTNSPTLTRMARSYILTVAKMLSFQLFSSDISTDFLQGKPQSSDRVLWIRLPKDAKMMLGMAADDSRVMRLDKSMYGLVDAPRAWYVEATSRILSIPNIQQHPLDACLFMIYDYDQPSQLDQNVQGRLVGMFGIHVDDMIGCGDETSEVFAAVKESLQKLFIFRTWQQATDSFEYCGCKCEVAQDHLLLQQTSYLNKMKPITIPAERKKDPNASLTPKETSMLRGLIGGLQWPATQTAPYLQCAVSQLAGEISTATINTIEHGHKVLRMAKSNSDTGLQYHDLGGDPLQVTFLAYSDASFASRKDLSSQGGYLISMVHHSVCSGETGHYNLVDWRSWKWPRIARSSLAAESQACSECADALMFACVFWKLLWIPEIPLDDVDTPVLAHPPCLVIDAKALYDLLTKDEIQAACGTDRRTAIETLVCQD